MNIGLLSWKIVQIFSIIKDVGIKKLTIYISLSLSACWISLFLRVRQNSKLVSHWLMMLNMGYQVTIVKMIVIKYISLCNCIMCLFKRKSFISFLPDQTQTLNRTGYDWLTLPCPPMDKRWGLAKVLVILLFTSKATTGNFGHDGLYPLQRYVYWM